MPEYKTGKGYSFWLYDDMVDNHLDHPRLLSSKAKAQKCINEWAKGVFEWVNLDLGPDRFPDRYRRIKDVGRSKDDLEIFPVLIVGELV